MSRTHLEIWHNCLRTIQTEIDAQTYKTWFVPIKPLRLEEDVLTIQVPNRFFYDWLEENYIELLKKAIRDSMGVKGRLEYWIPKSAQTMPSASIPTVSKELEKHYGQLPIRPPYSNQHNQPHAHNNPSPDKIKNPFVIPGIQKLKIDSQLNPDYTFTNYIEGDCNRLARSAGMAISKRPGTSAFNPLLIYSSVGLGKTHLAHAVGNEVKVLYPEKQVLYVTSEQFTNQFIDSMRNNAHNDFTNFYSQIDLLIVDDIQFLANKTKTQDIFFFIFNTLHQNGKQLILTSDRPPKDLEGIEDRLISRFKWGLSADLQVPSLETRLAIIQQKMQQDGVEIPHQVAEYISYSVRTNIRELEGILISIIAESALNQRDIDINLAHEVISKFVHDISEEISVEFVQKIVADYYKLQIQDLKEKTRTKLIVVARQLSMYLSKTICGKSLSEIGRAFGGRDHTTVLHACRSVEEMLQTDPAFKYAADDIKAKIKVMLPPD